MCRRFKIGDLVTAKQTYTGVTVSGEFCGYELEDKERPDLVVGTVIDRAGNQLYRVDLDSIQIAETSSEKLTRTLKEFLWNVANETVRSMPSAEQCQSWLSNLYELQEGARKLPAFSDEQIKSLKQARDYYLTGKVKLVGGHLSEIYERLCRWQNYDEKADQ